MKKFEIILPDRLASAVKKYSEDHDLEIHETMSRAVERLTSTGPCPNHITEWQKHIEMKLIDLQMQIDNHRIQDEPNSVLDRDLSKRHTGEKDHLDVSTCVDVKATVGKQTPKPVEPKVKEVDLNDLDLPL